MSSLPGDDADSVQPVARTPTTVVDGDVVLSGLVLLFVALALAFVVYHCLTVRRRGPRDAAGTLPSGRRGMRTDAASGGQGVDPVVLRELQVTLYRAKDFAEALECAVCLAELSDGEAARFLPKCGHGFHAECVDPWLRSHPTCPLCRVDIEKPDFSPTPSPLPLPPVLPEPANYSTILPSNVLFWGSHGAVTTARTVRAVGGPSSSGGVEVLVIEDVPEITAPVVAPRECVAAKSRGLARLRSLRRLWSRGRHEGGASSSSSCGRSSNTSDGAHTEHGAGVAVGDLDS